ncbi:quinone oxidoreductase [soil metagenome]
MLAVRIETHGGPEVMTVADVPEPSPGPGEVRVRHHAVGLNFIDVYQRTGLYPMKLPATLGLEAAGVVDAVGEGVERLKLGDRVAYNGTPGAYAEANVVRADRAVKLPDSVSFDTAAAALLKGMTAEFLVRRIWPLSAGDWVLVHAAAGGVGSILVPWLTHLGVKVIAVAGTAEKAQSARDNGAAEALVYGDDDLPERVRAITGGAKCRVVYDSVGKDTLETSVACVARRGLVVSYGNASGPAGPLAPSKLQQAGSASLTRPTLFDYIADTQSLDAGAAALFDVIAQGVVTAPIGQRFPLDQVRAAHEALEGRRTTGSTVLIPPGV